MDKLASASGTLERVSRFEVPDFGVGVGFRVPHFQRIVDEHPPIVSFLADHPPTTWTLNRVADGLPRWIAAQGEAAEVVELALLDGLVQAGFERPRVDPSPRRRWLRCRSWSFSHMSG